MTGLVEVMGMRLNPNGTREISVQKQGGRWVNIEIPGEKDPEKFAASSARQLCSNSKTPTASRGKKTKMCRRTPM